MLLLESLNETPREETESGPGQVKVESLALFQPINTSLSGVGAGLGRAGPVAC